MIDHKKTVRYIINSLLLDFPPLNIELSLLFLMDSPYIYAPAKPVKEMKYASNIRIIRVMCSGRVEPTFVIKAFREGADGVLICGCHPGDCHYHEGNYKCLRRFHLLQKYIDQMGMKKERLRLEWVSASEGKQFAELADEFSETIKKLGPCKIKEAMETIA